MIPLPRTQSHKVTKKKNWLLLEYVKKGLTGGVLMAIQAGTDANHKNEVGNTAVDRAQNVQTLEVLKEAGDTMPKFPEEKKNWLLHQYAQKV